MAGLVPRVAVVGGGIAGCTAAARLSKFGANVTLIEMGRGCGGRVATRRTREDNRIEVDHGAPMAQFMTVDGLTMAQELSDRGFVEEVVDPVWLLKPGASSLACPESQTTSVRLFKGRPTMSRWCEGLLDGASINTKFGIMVRGLEVNRDVDQNIVGWRLLDKDNGLIEECDWLIVAGSGVAHSRWSKTFGGVPPLVAAAADLNDAKLQSAIASIEAVGARPVQAVMLGFEGDAAEAWSSVPFTMAEIDGDDVIAKIVVQKRNGMVFVVAHSTHEFANANQDAHGSTSTAARLGGAANDTGREERVLEELVKGVDRCVSGFSPKPSTQLAIFGPLLHRWGNAFPEGIALASLEDGFIPTSRIVFVGDYVGQRSGSIEGALLSGAGAAGMLMAHGK